MNLFFKIAVLCGLCMFGIGLERAEAWECVEEIDEMTGELSGEKYVGTYSENELSGYVTSRLQTAERRGTTKAALRYILKSPKIEVPGGFDPKVYYENSVYLITQYGDEGFQVAWSDKSEFFGEVYYQHVRVKFDDETARPFILSLLPGNAGGWLYPRGFGGFSEDEFKKGLTVHKKIWVEVTPVGMNKAQIAKFSLAGFNEAFAKCGGSLKPIRERRKNEPKTKNSGALY